MPTTLGIIRKMKGIEMFYMELENRGYTIGETDTSKGETNGNFKIFRKDGKEITQNFKMVSEIYGTLTFYHFTPEDAIRQIFEMIEIQMNLN